MKGRHDGPSQRPAELRGFIPAERDGYGGQTLRDGSAVAAAAAMK
jgi:hypothetical protein